jgi:peptide/nickel transport system substrate-binding protein
VLESFSPEEGASFVRNETYWDSEWPLVDGVEIKFYRDDQASLIALQGDEIDTVITARVALVATIEQDDALEVDTRPGTGVAVVSMRVDTPPFDVKEARLAVATALDRAAVNTTLARGMGQLGNDHLIAPAFPTAPTDIPQRDVDLSEVRRLLDAAGLDELEFTLTYDTFTRDYAVLIQEHLSQAGINVTLEELTTDVFYAGDPDETPWLNRTATIVPWTSRATPTQFVVPMVRSNGVWNGSKYANAELDAATDGYDATVDEESQRQEAHTIAQLLHDDAPIVITWWAPAIRPHRTTWRGITAHPAQYLNLRAAEPA